MIAFVRDAIGRSQRCILDFALVWRCWTTACYSSIAPRFDAAAWTGDLQHNMNTQDHTFDQAALARPMPGARVVEWLRARRWFVLAVIVPTLLATLYYGLIASDVYTSESHFVVKNPNQKGPSISSLANIIQTTGLSAGQEQANEVIGYLRSRSALADLQKRIDVRARFASQNADFIARYPQFFREDRFENLYKAYQNRVNARLDTETGAIVLTVEAFNARDAHDINAELLKLSEEMVNRLNNRAETKAISEAQERVTAAEQRLLQARLAIRQYRNQEELIDPAKQAEGVLDLTNRLIAERTALQTQLETMERVTPANPGISPIRRRIAALDEAISGQTGRVVGSQGGIASKLGAYERLSVEQNFATQMLTVASAALEQARADVLKQKFYLERIVEPNTPDLATLPNRLRNIIVVLAATLCLYFIAWMFITGILEHAPDN